MSQSFRYAIQINRDPENGNYGTYYFEDYFQAKIAFDEHSFYEGGSVESILLLDLTKDKVVCKFTGRLER